MDEQRRDFVEVVEDEAVAPCYDRAGKGALGEAVARDEERGVAREEPDVDEVENGAGVAEVEEEVVPRAFLVVVRTDREEESRVGCI